jgi:hypothetical protein
MRPLAAALSTVFTLSKLRRLSKRCAVASVGTLALLALPAVPAHAQPAIKPIAQGVPGNSVFSADDYCESVYIKKSGSSWTLVQGSDDLLKDDSVEKLRGCMGYLGPKRADGQAVIDAVAFSLATRGTCDTEIRCEVNGNNKLATGCHPIFQKEFYKGSSPRSAGYYACNSSFVNRKLLGGLDFDAPIKTEALAAVLESDAIKTAAAAIVQSRHAALLARALQSYPAPCGNCVGERSATRFVFDYFAAQTSPADLEKAAFNYLAISGELQVPDWIKTRLPAEAFAQAAQRAEQEWRRKYAEQVQQLLAPDVATTSLKAFIDKFGVANPKTFATVDFDNLVPNARQRLTDRLARADADAKEAARKKAEAEALARKEEEKRVNAWRKTLALGSDTFCGPVIAVNGPMIKIAVRFQLQGFGNEAWLKAVEVFPPDYGCNNTNGRLSPY